MKKLAIIGAGISGLTVAQQLKDNFEVTVFEKESTPGGLIRCKRVIGSLFHICGGHVFNSKKQDVLDWFWKRFDQTSEFHRKERNSVVAFNETSIIPYPIENYIYLMDEGKQKKIISDLIDIEQDSKFVPSNFSDFLRQKFGQTLYDLYFRPYNEKVWRRDLQQIPLQWLEGKLPMPSVNEILFNNFNHLKEKQFVHSSFWYANSGGSQFIADRLAEGVEIHYDEDVSSLKRVDNQWYINNRGGYDIVVFASNIKYLPSMLKGVDISGYERYISSLGYHGTTSVFCEIDNNPYSWVYLPSSEYLSHRIICTGNFAASSYPIGRTTGTIEFTDEISEDEIKDNLKRIPLHPSYVDHCYNKYTYPIQDKDTSILIQSIKNKLIEVGLYMTGRFVDWEYYNMDAAMGAAIEISNNIKQQWV